MTFVKKDKKKKKGYDPHPIPIKGQDGGS